MRISDWSSDVCSSDLDADLEKAIYGAVSGIFAATGQTCIAGSRLLVQRGVHDEVASRWVDLAKTARRGDPGMMETPVGPVSPCAQRAKVLGHYARAQASCSPCIRGGRGIEAHAPGRGWFVEPHVFHKRQNTIPT